MKMPKRSLIRHLYLQNSVDIIFDDAGLKQSQHRIYLWGFCMSNIIRLGIVFFTLTVYGCASYDPVHVPMNFDAGDRYKTTDKLSTTPCSIYVREIDDKRRNKENLGRAASSTVYTNDIIEWIGQGLVSLGGGIYKVVIQKGNSDPVVPDYELSVFLKKAYIHSLSTSKSATLVLAVNYSQEGNDIKSSLYRGSDTSINWSSSQDEIYGAFNAAFIDLLDDLDKDLIELCRS